MNMLKIDHLQLDEDDERDNLIMKLQAVNEKLKFKLKDLEVMVDQTYDNAIKATKGNINSHRDWDTQDETLKEKDKQLREFQAQIEGCKKNVKKLKGRLNALTNMEKMTQVDNELKDAQRIRKELEDEVRMLHKYQTKALKSKAENNDYEEQMQKLSTELSSLRDNYRQMAIDNKEKEIAQKEQHKKLVDAREKNSKLKRILIAIKNNKDPFTEINNVEEMAASKRKEIESYDQTMKSEDKRHKLKLKKLEEQKTELENEIQELEQVG
jgi:chromosome segregation ATPase